MTVLGSSVEERASTVDDIARDSAVCASYSIVGYRIVCTLRRILITVIRYFIEAACKPTA